MKESNIKYYLDIIREIDKLSNSAVAIERNLSNNTMKKRLNESIDKLKELRRLTNFKLNELGEENIEIPDLVFMNKIKELNPKELYRLSRKFYYSLDKEINKIKEKLGKDSSPDSFFVDNAVLFAFMSTLPQEDRQFR